MTRRCLALALAALLLPAGCSPGDDEDPVDPADPTPIDAAFAPQCGVAAPHHLITLAEGDALIAGGLTRLGDRYYLGAERVDSLNELLRIYSVGLCGEDPRVVAEGIRDPTYTDGSLVFALSPWPTRPLACNGVGPSGDLVALDPLGEVEPELLIEWGCGSATHDPRDAGLVVTIFNEDSPSRVTLRLYPYDDAADRPGLLPPVEIDDAYVTWGSFDSRPAVLEDEIIYIREGSQELVHRSLGDLSETILAADVDDFAASAGFLLYRRGAAVILRDRKDDAETQIADVACDGCLAVDARAAWALRDRSGYGGGVVVDLERGLRSDVPPGRRPLRLLDDGRWLLGSADGEVFSADLEVGDERLVAEGLRYSFDLDDDGLVRTEDLDGRRAIYRAPYDGSPRELLAMRSGPFMRIADGRVVTVAEADDAGLGDLVVVERGTLREHRVDTEVRAYPRALAAAGALEPDVIAYQVVDGDRSGIYLADLSAP
ncbi:MAG: hypothetical protein H6710_09880 [Myxococcales bacterium]|nr:hypothetical protein [Myxococcales bacterium]